ncbi:MAG: hypothetical protein NTV01_02050 [Bacteroidia bacterium]|nr:hypothetical protein [Bacteroidia bacterium]
MTRKIVNWINMWRSMADRIKTRCCRSFMAAPPGRPLYPELMATNFMAVTEFKVPVYLVAGRYNYNTANPLVEAWFKNISAPKKEFFWF